MAKFLLTSILIMTVAIPMRFASARDARAGLRKTVIGSLAYIWFWIFFCAYIYLRIKTD